MNRVLDRIMIGCVSVIGFAGAIRIGLFSAYDAQLGALIFAAAALVPSIVLKVVKKRPAHG